MTLRWLLAALHLLALGLGLGGIWARSRALAAPLDAAGLKRVFAADNWWGIAALLWIVTGLTRLLSSTEKPLTYYLHNYFFHLKMTTFLVIFLLELWPMITLIRWRIAVRQGRTPDTSRGRTFSRISAVQAVLLVVMVLAATAMARGMGEFSDSIR
jgi:putative membrane protein